MTRWRRRATFAGAGPDLIEEQLVCLSVVGAETLVESTSVDSSTGSS